jgi:flavin-dependent dehydrogenase
MDKKFAAVVVGGGPAGTSAAITLARAGQRVILIDDHSGRFKIGEALAPASRLLLRDLGVMDRFLDEGHLACYGNVSAWGSSETQCTDFVCNPHGHGWHLDRTRFDSMLQDEASIAGAEVLLQARLMSVEHEHGSWRIIVRKEDAWRELHANWLIDATGRSSYVARKLGAKRIYDDRLLAFFIRLRSPESTQLDSDSRTFVEAAPDGWWYTALLPSGERILVFFTDTDLAEKVALKTFSGFRDLLEKTQHVRTLINSHGYRPDGDPRGFDAGTARLDSFGGNGWFAVGDAAVSFDPLSSQGILNALYLGLKAGQAISASLAGETRSIKDYLLRLENIYDAHKTNKSRYYAAERRWPERLFWQRRTVG